MSALLIKFTSPASPDVTLHPETATIVLRIIGKAMGERGVITAAELPDALVKLDAAIRLGKDHDGALAKAAAGSTPHAAHDEDAISIDQRAWPFREMLRESRDQSVDILWGV